MPTSFTKSIYFNSVSAKADFGTPSILNDGSFTFIIGVKLPTSFNGFNIVSKNDDNNNNNGYATRLYELSGSAYADTKVARATTASVYRANPAFTLNAWQWIAFSLDRATPAFKWYSSSYGSSLTDSGATELVAGTGSVTSDASYALTLGGNPSQLITYPLNVFFFGRWNSVLSLSTINSYVSDMDANGKASSVLYVKPASGDTSAVDTSGNGNNGTWSGTVSIADGPDPATTAFRPYYITG